MGIELPSLKNQREDYITSMLKGILGAAPFAGSLISELVSNIIPNQRIDRIGKFASELEIRLKSLEESFIYSKLKDETFTDLLQEGIKQAIDSLSDERRQYIADLLVNGLNSQDVSFIESKHLLKILGELNDIEILWLRYFLYPTHKKDREFHDKNKHIFEIPYEFTEASNLQRTLKDSYLRHLVKLGLLEPVYETIRPPLETMGFTGKSTSERQPVFDSNGNMKVVNHRITGLGQILLRQISLVPNELPIPNKQTLTDVSI